MTLSRKDCRRFADPHWKIDVKNGLFCADQIKYILRTTVRNIAGRRVLILYFYDCAGVQKGLFTPCYTIFQSRYDYITLQHGDDGKEKWITASLDNLVRERSQVHSASAFYRKIDEQRAQKFCRSDSNGLNAICSLQAHIMADRLRARIKKREQKIVDQMRGISSLPKRLESWAAEIVLPAYIFYYYTKGQKQHHGYCTACCSDVLVTGAKHAGAGICPNCKRKITFKALGRSTEASDRATIQVIQRAGNGLVLRICKIFSNHFSNSEPRFSIWENARIFISGNGERTYYYYDQSKGFRTHWREGTRPIQYKYSYNFPADSCGYLYPGNLKQALQRTPWQYCQIKAFSQADYEPMEVMPYLRTYLDYPVLEYLVKLRLYRLASDLVYRHDGIQAINVKGKKLQEVLGVQMADIPILQSVDPSAKLLCLYKDFKAHNIRFDEKFLLWCQHLDISGSRELLYCLRFTTAGKLVRYITEQYPRLYEIKAPYGGRRYERPLRVFTEYHDYLRLCADLKYNLTDDFILFPRYLEKAHDRASDAFEIRKTEIYDKSISSAYEMLMEKYRFEKYGFIIVPPKTSQEIVAEGHSLHHCVGSYVSRVVKGECIVLFLRQRDNPTKPFYTIELQNEKIVQARGASNGEPSAAVKKYLALWESKKLGYPEKVASKAA